MIRVYLAPLYNRYHFSRSIDAIDILDDHYLIGHNHDLVKYQKTPSGEFTLSESINIECSIQDITVADEGFFVSSGKRGILVYNSELELINQYTNESHAIGANHIKQTFIDDNSRIWVITMPMASGIRAQHRRIDLFMSTTIRILLERIASTRSFNQRMEDMWFGY